MRFEVGLLPRGLGVIVPVTVILQLRRWRLWQTMNRLGLLAIVALISSCGAQNPSTTKMYDPLHRVQFSIDHISGPALTEAKDRVYIKNGDKQELIFEGYGGRAIVIKPLRDGVVLIEYCGGSIRKVASFLANRARSESAVAVIIQPVVIYNVEVDGNRLCAE